MKQPVISLDFTDNLRYLTQTLFFFKFLINLKQLFQLIEAFWLSLNDSVSRTLNRCSENKHYRCCGEADVSY
ncbi:hypothetical protein HMPREF9370_0959 [Neisseria wadsworthii 9715]|uniref:Uncharacterized protein n=1 Tax=Neisseria wadsworthii 9715 TaxID=1030841 RepID=G4CPE9_9NEIS|nr:hypothetical protein HMPREF9370_0959 [Neisseria wadsworthii 9715]